MKRIMLFFLITSFVLLFSSVALAQDPSGALDTVYVTPTSAVVGPGGGTVTVTIRLKTDNTGAGNDIVNFNLPIDFDGSTCGTLQAAYTDTVGDPDPGHIAFTTGNDLGAGNFNGLDVNLPDYWFDFILYSGAGKTAGDYLWGTLKFDVAAGAAPCVICIDTAFFSAAVPTIVFATSGTAEYQPYYAKTCIEVLLYPNSPPVVDCGGPYAAFSGGTFNHTVLATDPDDAANTCENIVADSFDIVEDPPSEGAATLGPPGPLGSPTVSRTFNWPTAGTAAGTYHVAFFYTDECGGVGVDTCTYVIKSACAFVKIGTVKANPGEAVFIPILIQTNECIGGFDLDVEVSNSELTPLSVVRGNAIDDKDSTGKFLWEYFTFRLEPSTIIHKYKIHIVGIADLPDGHDPQGLQPDTAFVELAKIKVVLATNENFRCFRSPVRFEWHSWECTENALSDCSGNLLFVSDDTTLFNPNDCPPDQKNPWVACVHFEDGGVIFRCLDELDPPQIGDVNLNGFPYEIADAVLFSNYFIYGEGVFTINRDGQVAGTDINRDGFVLTISDLVYLIRIIQGDASPLGKVLPGAGVANIYFDGKSVSSSEELGAALFVFKGGEGITLEAKNLFYHNSAVVNGELRVILVADKGGRIEAGTNLFTVKGEAELVEVKAADYSSNELGVTIVNRPTPRALPTSFGLEQNYPNPFNASTSIRFALPSESKVSLKIYNIAGQTVKTVDGVYQAGNHSIVWDGTSDRGEVVASGVYFYKLVAGNFSRTMKMVLLK